MVNDPILEALNFALERDLQVEDVRVPSTSTSTSGSLSDPLYSRRPLGGGGPAMPRNSQKILPSSLILGEGVETPCPLPGCDTIRPVSLSRKEDKEQFLAHLLTQHQIVIDDVDKIANLHKYIIHWKERFLSGPLSEFCVGFVMDALPTPVMGPARPRKRRSPNGEEDSSSAANDKALSPAAAEGAVQPSLEKDKDKLSPPPPTPLLYYMLTPALPEDKELRSKLWNSRLETILEVNRQEREQVDFSRQCFFCREVSSGNRASLFDHMNKDHSFRIGAPDNVVFVEEFLELIANKLAALVCLHCEKVFKDKTILRDHMRKKGHKRLNSNNPEYNRYYVINYLEPGKDWKAFEEEDQEDERIEEDWMEADEEGVHIVCLLCSEQSSHFEDILSHMKTRHCFDFVKISEHFDFYQKVKVVNFIRRTVFLNVCLYCETKFFERSSLLEHISSKHTQPDEPLPSEKVWNQPEYFFPTYENDAFLVLLDKDMDLEDKEDVNSIVSSEDDEHRGGIVIPEDLPKLSQSCLPHCLNQSPDPDRNPPSSRMDVE